VNARSSSGPSVVGHRPESTGQARGNGRSFPGIRAFPPVRGHDGPTRTDVSPPSRLEIPSWSWSNGALGRANAPAIWGASYGGGRIGGPGAPAPPASSPSSRPDTASSPGSPNPRARVDDRAGARTGAVVGNPKCLRIFPTTSGSERSASTIIGTVCAAVEHLGHARPFTHSTRRRSCSQENLRRCGPGGSANPPAPSPCSCTSAEAAVSDGSPPEMSGACRDGGGGGNNLRALLRLAKMPCYADIETMLSYCSEPAATAPAVVIYCA
jgi:hypothetical protein